MIMGSQSQDETAVRRTDDSIMTDDEEGNAPARARPALLDAATGAGLDGGDPVIITDEAAPATGRGHCDFAALLSKVRKTNVSVLPVGHRPQRRDR